MTIAIKLTMTLATLALAMAALTGCAVVATAPQAAEPSSTPTASPTPTPTQTYLTELPEWAEGTWLVYPDGMECFGTEGCPNDYRAFFGEPGPVLPERVVYYDPAQHDCVLVQPADVTC
ncbi:hypothetical protein B1729_14555 [Microbacterium sp. B35-04]|uniref:hypothetical protein n=1 Tax=Microbacterium sp. B35-04 TaxID=1961716 RepID=UPI0013D5CBE0|nr:hypothetical protein [Microbacterium sp. B35-04]KAF2412530.1 hypothetical protein B1729_14555 [Microbacterium sp. B35-04]